VNDWLGGSWFFFFGSMVALFGCGCLLIAVWVENNAVMTFMYGTS
jgi:hypothetical protein